MDRAVNTSILRLMAISYLFAGYFICTHFNLRVYPQADGSIRVFELQQRNKIAICNDAIPCLHCGEVFIRLVKSLKTWISVSILTCDSVAAG